MSDSANNEKFFTKDAEEGAIEVSEKQAVPEYVGKGKSKMFSFAKCCYNA